MDECCLNLFFKIAYLVVPTIGVFLTFIQVKKIKERQKEDYDWNKRIEAQKALEGFPRREAQKLRTVFGYETNKDYTISLEKIEKKFEEDSEVKSSLGIYLDFFEGIACGVNQKIYDEPVIKTNYKTAMIRAYYRFQNYIRKGRGNDFSSLYSELENLVKKWESNDKENTKRNEVVT